MYLHNNKKIDSSTKFSFDDDYIALFISTNTINNDVSLIYLGRSYQMTSHKERFFTYISKKIVGNGNGNLCFWNERIKMLDNFLNILRLLRNLLLESKFNDLGMCVIFDNSTCRLVEVILWFLKDIK